jgi:hypothetical protein
VVTDDLTRYFVEFEGEPRVFADEREIARGTVAVLQWLADAPASITVELCDEGGRAHPVSRAAVRGLEARR